MKLMVVYLHMVFGLVFSMHVGFFICCSQLQFYSVFFYLFFSFIVFIRDVCVFCVVVLFLLYLYLLYFSYFFCVLARWNVNYVFNDFWTLFAANLIAIFIEKWTVFFRLLLFYDFNQYFVDFNYYFSVLNSISSPSKLW